MWGGATLVKRFCNVPSSPIYSRRRPTGRGGRVPGTGDPIQRALRGRAADLRGEYRADDPGGGTTRRMFLGRAAAVGLGTLAAWPAAGAAASRQERRAQRAHQRRHGARIVIVGAGLAGLTCAYRLRQHGVHADVFEARTDRLGGRCWNSAHLREWSGRGARRRVHRHAPRPHATHREGARPHARGPRSPRHAVRRRTAAVAQRPPARPGTRLRRIRQALPPPRAGLQADRRLPLQQGVRRRPCVRRDDRSGMARRERPRPTAAGGCGHRPVGLLRC